MLHAARRDPEALVGGHEQITLDEVQREPGLLSAVKRAIDRNRSAGRLLLTGSANLLLMRQVSESLAGRASYLTLWPMTRREQLLDTSDEGWRDLLAAGDEHVQDWRALAYRGGFPTLAIELARPAERAIWFDGYVRTFRAEYGNKARAGLLLHTGSIVEQTLGDMFNQVQYRRDSIVIKRDGKPVAALVDARLFERIEAGYAEVPEAEGLAEFDAAVAASRAGR